MHADANFLSAAVCADCGHCSLFPDEAPEAGVCVVCGADNLRVPGARFLQRDALLFAQLDRVVQRAQLSRSEATLIAAELGGVGSEGAEPVLQRIGKRLSELHSVCATRPLSSQQLLIAGTLLTIVCARMLCHPPEAAGTGAKPRRLSQTVATLLSQRKAP